MSKIFAIGDIHGEYEKLQIALEKANVDFDNDKVIQLGDIMDRGINPFKCIDILLKIKNCIFIRGNHDEVFLNWINSPSKQIHDHGFGGHHGSDISMNLWKSLSYDDQDLYYDFLLNKQINYHIDEENRFFVHAGMNRHNKVEDHNDNLIFLWDRDFIMAAMSYKEMGNNKMNYPFRIKNGFKEIYLGHTPTQYWNKDFPICCGNDNIWNLDTGAGKFGEKGFVTIMNIETKEYFQG